MPSNQTVSAVGERALIARIEARVPHTHESLLRGIGDDAAVVRPTRNRATAITTDMLVEDVHFRRQWSSPADIGAKAILVNLSDLCAMGAEPQLATLSLALPSDLPLEEFDQLIEGVGESARTAGIAIAGGNLTRSSGPLVVDVTAVGAVHARKALRRDGARPGDAVYVTGSLGAGAAGVAWLEQNGVPAQDHAAWGAVRRACRPDPPLRAGVTLSRAGASVAAIDLSDGLADGLRRLAESSGFGISVDAAALPIDPSAAAIFHALSRDPVHAAVAGGDDYELLFTVPARRRGRFRSARRHLGTLVTRIGIVTADRQLRLNAPPASDPINLAGLGFDHFGAGSASDIERPER